MNAFDFFFEQSASLDKDFVLGNRETVSYTKLFSDCLNLSNQLIQQYGTNNNIIILSENSVFFITAYLSVLKSGNICVPLNPMIEEENLKDIVIRTNCRLAFASKRYTSKFDKIHLEAINPDRMQSFLVKDDTANPNDESIIISEDQLAEIIFTSGSTGKQKGVMITHRNLIANTSSILQYLNLTHQDTVEVVMPFYYCYGLSLLHTHLRVGGSLVLNNSFVFIGSVINDLNKYRCTGFSGVPSHFQILLRKTRDFKNTKFETLRYVTQAGGKLHNTFIEEFTGAFPQIKFYVMYGQTEATARLSYLKPDLLLEKMGSIGKAIPGVDLMVVNEKGDNVKPGEVGEIIAHGDNIMKGYFEDFDSTALTLKNGWLHTGDMATIDDSGFIYIQSRAKEIIKIRGIRISPKEIEEVIVSYPGVIDCSILAMEDNLLGEALKAIVYINDADKEFFNSELIQKHCQGRLASFKIPQIVEFETKLVFNEAGKKIR